MCGIWWYGYYSQMGCFTLKLVDCWGKDRLYLFPVFCIQAGSETATTKPVGWAAFSADNMKTFTNRKILYIQRMLWTFNNWENDDKPWDFGVAPISQKTILYLQLTSACQVCPFSFGIPDCLSLHSRYNNIIWSAENGYNLN